MSSFLDELTEGKIDFGGQHMVDNISRIVLVLATFLAFCIGLAMQDIRATFTLLGIAVLGLAFVVLPPWPMFNQHPVQWLPPPPVKE